MVKWWFDKAWVCGTSLCILQGPYRLWTHYGPGMWPLVLPSKKDFYKCDRFSHCFQGSLLVNQWTCCWIDLKLWVPGRSNLVRLKVDPIHVMSWCFYPLRYAEWVRVVMKHRHVEQFRNSYAMIFLLAASQSMVWWNGLSILPSL